MLVTTVINNNNYDNNGLSYMCLLTARGFLKMKS